MTAVDTSKDAEKDEKKADRWDAMRLTDYVLEHYTVGTSTDGATFAVPNDPRAPRVAVSIRSLNGPLRKMLRERERVAVGRETMTLTLDTVEAVAGDYAPTTLHLRVCQKPASIEIDLADTVGRYVEISAYGWEVRAPQEEEDPTPSRAMWRRTRATQPLPAPVAGGSRDDLRNLLGLEEDDPRWRLLWGWAVASVFAEIPRPILWATGPQGSGKSTRANMVLNLVDPAEKMGKEPGKNERDDSTSAIGRYAPSWDNIGTISAATSDWLCRLVTGVEISRRALYSDDDLRISTIKRTGVATSIVLPFGLGPDALERLVLTDFDRVDDADRQVETELWDDYVRLRPGILGALYDDVAGVLAHRSAVRAEVKSLPRMADYALILHALDRHLEIDAADGFAAAYITHLGVNMAERAASDPLTAALLDLVSGTRSTWSGTAEELHEAIDHARPNDPKAGWPPSGQSLSTVLVKNSETHRAAGLLASRKKTNRNGRSVRLVVLERLAVDADLDAEPEPTKPEPVAVARTLQGGIDLDDIL